MWLAERGSAPKAFTRFVIHLHVDIGAHAYPAVNYTHDDVLADIDGSGLTIDRAEEVTRPVDTPDGERHAIDTLIWAHRAQATVGR